MTRSFIRTTVFQFAILLIFLLPILFAGGYVWNKHMWAKGRLAELEPVHARLQGLGVLLPELELAVKNAQDKLGKTAYPANMEAAKVGNDAQQKIRSVFEASQLTIASMQVLEPKEEGRFQRIRIVLAVEGVLPKYQEVFLRLKDLSPQVIVESFALQSIGAAKPLSSQNLSGSFEISVLRVSS